MGVGNSRKPRKLKSYNKGAKSLVVEPAREGPAHFLENFPSLLDQSLVHKLDVFILIEVDGTRPDVGGAEKLPEDERTGRLHTGVVEMSGVDQEIVQENFDFLGASLRVF